MKRLAGIVFLISFSCMNGGSAVETRKQETVVSFAEPGYTWNKLLDSAAWRKNYNFQMFTIRDTAWVFHPDGCWYSVDGKKWTFSDLGNPMRNQAFLDYVFFKGAMYGLGRFEGNIERFDFKPQIYRSSNLRNWDTVSINSNLPRRFFYHPFVFREKIWIIGGEDKDRQYADIWNSPDGIQWTRVSDRAPFGARSSSKIVTLGGKLYLLNNDVWVSSDGLVWEKLAGEILKGEQLFGYAAVVFDQRIWLLGCNRNGLFSSQVLHSADGKNWVTQEAPWLPRGGVAATVFNGKILMTGGKYGGTPGHPDFRYDNDLWALEKK